MANISLRAYRREIEELIGQGRIDEVIAHCRHILKFYPKDVAVYRLLAKAYLESQRFSDATDIFQRVLSVVPDDFVSHVGMSIIREDEGNLDASIWHMERAFEVQPSNAAIRDELRRLFGKRDGMEPPKIRLTRGALARMYSQGNLYQQSIGELRAALAEDPQRFDLQVLLARMFYFNGQQVEAAETCNSVISKLPFCLDANRILTEILTTSERAQEADLYHQRVKVIDPYAAHAPANNLLTEQIPEDAVTLVRLDWEPGQGVSELDSQPSWASSLGIELEDSSPGSGLPEWLTDDEDESSEPSDSDLAYSSQPYSYDESLDDQPAPEVEAPSISTPEPTEASMDFNETLPPDEDPEDESSQEPGELIPDWMKDAGWATSTGEPVEEPPISGELDPPETQAPEQTGDLAAADIPEWLQDIAPAEAEEDSPPAVETDEEMSGEIPSWLSSRPPGPTDSVVMWLKNKPEEDEQPPSTGDLDQPIDETAGDEVPDWLQSVASSIEVPEEDEAVEQPEVAADPDDITEEIPEPIVAEEPPREAFPDPIELDSDATVISEPVELPAAEEPVAEVELEESPILPDWEAEVSAAPPDSIEDTRPRKPAVEEEPIETVIAPLPVDEVEAKEPETPPSFVPDETLPSMEKPDIEEPAPVGMFDSDFEAEEAPVEAEAEPVPDWLKEMEAEAEAPIEASAPMEEVPDWLQEIEQVSTEPAEEPAAEPEPVTAEAESPAEEVPDWLQQIGEETAAGATMELPELQEDFPEPVEEPVAPTTQEDVPDWLQGLEAEEAPEEVPLEASFEEAAPELEEAIPSEPVAEEGMPDWLLEMEQEAQTVEAPVVSEEGFDFPSEPVAEAPPPPVAETPAEALPSWLAEATGSETRKEDEETQPSPIEADALESLPAADAPSLEDTDAAIAWLESLAAKQGAAEEELVMDPEARGETPPDWVTESMSALDGEEEQPAEVAEVEPVKQEPLPDQPDWMTETLISDTMVPEEDETPEEAAPIEEWALDTLERTEDEEVEEITPKPLVTRELDLDWIQEAGEAEPTPEAPEPVEAAEPLVEAEPLAETPSAEEETPDFLAEAEEVEVGLPTALAEELATEETPDWLGIGAEPEAEEEPDLTVPQPAETRELGAEWMMDTGIPEEVVSEIAEVVEPEEVEEPAPALEDTLTAEILPELQEPMEPKPAEELEPEWMLETALPPEDLAEDAEEIFDAETLIAPVPEELREPAQVEVDVPSEEPIEEPGMEAEAGPDWMLETALPGELEAALSEAETVEPEPELAEEPLPAPELFEEVAPEPEPVMEIEPEPLPAAPEPIKPDTGLLYNELLTNAKESLAAGDISEALVGYTRLVRRKRHLEVVIEDLQDALYRHPVDTDLLETLGDAYVKANSLQDALDAYTKAEDLLRS
jgi:cytochrome c-type biogenesis protein CcmH/NrfG